MENVGIFFSVTGEEMLPGAFQILQFFWKKDIKYFCQYFYLNDPRLQGEGVGVI
jgi:hypothetical protein